MFSLLILIMYPCPDIYSNTRKGKKEGRILKVKKIILHLQENANSLYWSCVMSDIYTQTQKGEIKKKSQC